MHRVQSIGYAAAYPAYPLNPPLVAGEKDNAESEGAIQRHGTPIGVTGNVVESSDIVQFLTVGSKLSMLARE